MQAVAEVYRKRGAQAFSTLRRKDLDKFISRQGAKVLKDALRAWEDSASSNLTKGATHYESVDFPVPYWAKSMKKTVRIGKHQFYREVRK